MDIKPGYEDKRNVAVRFTCKSRESARYELGFLERELLPPGYVIDKEVIQKPRGAVRGTKGARVNVTVVLFHRDTREPEIKFDEFEEQLGALDVK